MYNDVPASPPVVLPQAPRSHGGWGGRFTKQWGGLVRACVRACVSWAVGVGVGVRVRVHVHVHVHVVVSAGGVVCKQGVEQKAAIECYSM